MPSIPLSQLQEEKQTSDSSKNETDIIPDL